MVYRAIIDMALEPSNEIYKIDGLIFKKRWDYPEFRIICEGNKKSMKKLAHTMGYPFSLITPKLVEIK